MSHSMDRLIALATASSKNVHVSDDHESSETFSQLSTNPFDFSSLHFCICPYDLEPTRSFSDISRKPESSKPPSAAEIASSSEQTSLYDLYPSSSAKCVFEKQMSKRFYFSKSFQQSVFRSVSEFAMQPIIRLNMRSFLKEETTKLQSTRFENEQALHKVFMPQVSSLHSAVDSIPELIQKQPKPNLPTGIIGPVGLTGVSEQDLLDQPIEDNSAAQDIADAISRPNPSSDAKSSANMLFMTGARDVLSGKRSAPKKKAGRPGYLLTADLEPGDVLLIQGDSMVSSGQAIAQWFGPDLVNKGNASSVHAAIICSKQIDGTLESAHIIFSGGARNFVVDEDSGDHFTAHVYRAFYFPEIASAAATQAMVMVQSRKIQFASSASISSVFLDPRDGKYLDGNWETYKQQSKRQQAIEFEMNYEDVDLNNATRNHPSYAYFCSEFVATCYQEAIMGLLGDDRSTLTLMNLDPAACPPMLLEGYFKHQPRFWSFLGKLDFNFC